MMKYLTRAKKVNPELPDVFPASKAPIPAKSTFVETKDAINRFVRDNPRTEKAGGGMLVQPGFGGTRQGYKNEKKLNKTMEKRIADYESKTGNKYEDQPNWRKKDIRDGNWTGGGKGEKFKDPKFIKQKSEGTQIQKVRDYLSSAIRDNKGKPVTFKTIAEIKKGAGVTANIDADITRVLQSDKFTNKINLRNFEKLPDEIIKEIKSSFSNLVPKDKWNFDKHKFGINKTDIDVRVYDRIRRFVEDPKPLRYGFRFENPDGWMLTQMDRAYRSGNKSYKPIYAVVNKVRKVVGYVDNTDKGGGKKYFASDIYIKGKNSDGILIKGTDKTLPHPDYAENVKYHDIVMKSGQPPNKAIRDILTKGGIAGSEKIKMRHVLNFILDNSDYNAARSSIVRHHKGQLKNATSDLQILNRVQNVKVTGIEDRISQGIILPEDIAKLKNFGVSVRGPDGTLYGGGPRTPEGGLRDINKLILEGSKNVDLYGKEIKGLKDFTKADFDLLKKKLASLGGGTCSVQFGKGNKDGGRIGYKTGPASLEDCIKSGAKNFNDGNLKTADQIKDGAKLLRGGRAVLSAISKYGVVPELAYVGLEAAGRTVLGEQPTNALLKSIDTLTFGATDFTSGIEAEKFGEYAKDKLAVDKFQESQAKVRSILDNISRLEELNLEGGDIDVTQNIQTLKAQLQSASDELRANTVNPDMVQFITQRGDEIADAQLAKSSYAQQSLTDQLEGFPGIKDYTDTEATRVFPFQQTQQQLNEKVLPTPFILRAKTSDIINDIVPALRAQGVTVDGRPIGTKDVLNYQKQLREQPLSQVVEQGFNPESFYGASGTFSTPLPSGALDKKPNVIPEMEREIVGQTNVANPFDIDISDIGSGLRGFSAAGGGIAKQAGVSSGPPPESGPMSQGLQGLMKRVKNR